MKPYCNILPKVEDAWYSYLKQIADTEDVHWYRSMDMIDAGDAGNGVEPPFVSILAGTANPANPEMNLDDNYFGQLCTVTLLIRTLAKSQFANETAQQITTLARDYHASLVGQVLDAIYLPVAASDPETRISLTSALNAQAVPGISFETVYRPAQQGPMPGPAATYRTTITIECLVHPIA